MFSWHGETGYPRISPPPTANWTGASCEWSGRSGCAQQGIMKWFGMVWDGWTLKLIPSHPPSLSLSSLTSRDEESSPCLGFIHGKHLLIPPLKQLGFLGRNSTLGGVAITLWLHPEGEIIQILNTGTFSLLPQNSGRFGGCFLVFVVPLISLSSGSRVHPAGLYPLPHPAQSS